MADVTLRRRSSWGAVRVRARLECGTKQSSAASRARVAGSSETEVVPATCERYRRLS